MSTSIVKTKETPWASATNITKQTTIADALKEAGLGYTVSPVQVFASILNEYHAIDNRFATVRDDTHDVLGIVSSTYKIVQNEEALNFMDALLLDNLELDKAMTYDKGRKLFISSKLPARTIAGEKYGSYLLFVNSHDGSGGVKVAITPVRAICKNTVPLALKNAERKWTISHRGDVKGKLLQAQELIKNAGLYLDVFDTQMNTLLDKKLPIRLVRETIAELIPIPPNASGKSADDLDTRRELLMSVYNDTPDIKKFKGTGYGLFQAVTDFSTHVKPIRVSTSYSDKLITSTVEGHKFVQKAYDLIRKAA